MMLAQELCKVQVFRMERAIRRSFGALSIHDHGKIGCRNLLPMC